MKPSMMQRRHFLDRRRPLWRPGRRTAPSRKRNRRLSADPVVLEQARALAAAPFVAPEPLPEALLNLGSQDFASIRYRDERRLFLDPPTGFAVDLIHAGFIYGVPVQIAVVEGGVARRIAFDPALYDYGSVPAPGRRGDRLRGLPWPHGAEPSRRR